jgi:hypothetical protein
MKHMMNRNKKAGILSPKIQLLPLLHPYAELIDGELRHVSRYPSYPHIGLLLQHEPETDAEDLRIINALYSPIARSFQSQLVYSTVINNIVHVFTHRMRRLGQAFGETGTLNATLLKQWAYPERFPSLVRRCFLSDSACAAGSESFDHHHLPHARLHVS